jgi:hypothetical protein
MSRKKKAKTPQEIVADLEAYRARKRTLEDYQRQPDLQITTAPGHYIVAIQRLDVFELLLQRKAITTEQHGAVRRLEHDIALSLGEERPEASLDRVDTTSLGQNINGTMIDAGGRVKVILANCGPVSAQLLDALLKPQEAIFTRWRVTVERVTRETRAEAQTAAIRAACSNLAEAYRQHDYRSAA